MKARHAAGKINKKPAIGKNVAAKKNIVWRVQGGQVHHLKVDLGGREVEPDHVAGSDNGAEARYVCGGFPNFVKSKFCGETGPQTRATGTGVDLGTHGSHALAEKGHGRNSDIECGTVLENVLDRLLDYDFGPGGFFIVCHPDHPVHQR